MNEIAPSASRYKAPPDESKQWESKMNYIQIGKELLRLMDAMAASESDDEDQEIRDKVRDIAADLIAWGNPTAARCEDNDFIERFVERYKD
jgi:predicted GTPase